MAFDRFNQDHLNQLKTEVVNDPITMGYGDIGNTSQNRRLINNPASNVGGESVQTMLTVENLHKALEIADYTSTQVGDAGRSYLENFLAMPFETEIEQFRAKIESIFQANDPTRTNLDNQNRTLSRAEVLWGEGTDISKDDYITARDSGVVL